MTRTTPLLSSKSPVVNPTAIALPVLTAVGEWAHLEASPTQWRKIVADLAAPLGLDVRPAKARASNLHLCKFERSPVRKPGGRLL